MRQRILNNYHFNDIPKTPDGNVFTLGIEQFPVEPFNFNKFGFPKSDVTILIEATMNSGIYNDKFDRIASRLNVIRATEYNKDKTLEELWRDYKPASIATAAEEKAFAAYWQLHYGESVQTNSEVKKTELSIDTTESTPVTDASSEK